MTSLTDTSVNVSWNAVIIPDFSIDNYTVVYSPVSESRRRQLQDGEMTAEFPGSVLSGIITGLDPGLSYQFQVFATVTVDGVPLEGERSTPETSGQHLSCYKHNYYNISSFCRCSECEYNVV